MCCTIQSAGNDTKLLCAELQRLCVRAINSLTYPKLGSYIAGLIEGDGTFHVPQLERAPSGKLNYPAVQIAFALKDYPRAAYLRLVIGQRE